MKQRTLFKIALICSVIGIFILMAISESIDIEESQINKLDQKEVDDEVRVRGTVLRITEKEDLTILEISKKESIPVIIFDDGVNVSKGDKVEVQGKLEEFRDEMEIIGDNILIIR